MSADSGPLRFCLLPSEVAILDWSDANFEAKELTPPIWLFMRSTLHLCALGLHRLDHLVEPGVVRARLALAVSTVSVKIAGSSGIAFDASPFPLNDLWCSSAYLRKSSGMP